MSAWGALGPGTRVLILVAGGLVAVGAGYLVWQSAHPAEVAFPVEPVAQAPKAQDDVAATATKPAEQATVAEVDPAVVAARDLPAIDTWRVAPDGEALVAGVAAPMAGVAVLVDGVKVAEGLALASGEFALQFTLPPNPAPSLMTLSMTETGKPEVISDAMVALGPISGPAPVPAPVPATAAAPEAESAAGDAAATGTDPALATVSEAPPAPDALLVTGEGAVVLQGDTAASPAMMTQVMIDTITYTPAGEVQVGGRGAAGSTVRIYLDNAEVAVLTVPEIGLWVATLGDTAPGIYTLRADQLGESGEVTSRFETPFQRETREALALAAGAEAPAKEAAQTPAVDETPAALAPAELAGDSAAGTVAEAGPDLGAEVAASSEPAPEPVSEPVEEPAVTGPEPEAPATVSAAGTPPQPPVTVPVTVTVQPGFTLWGIAQDRLGDGVLYVQVFDANRDKIGDPDLIYPGQVLSVPATP
ncbi:MAG: LysM peptidoglycan-binding domain-containing protein [Rhodobacterales bacterium]|nr:LysM peptidoglycan-binding domain-containing protein [Rhodobacterales bacterium]